MQSTRDAFDRAEIVVHVRCTLRVQMFAQTRNNESAWNLCRRDVEPYMTVSNFSFEVSAGSRWLIKRAFYHALRALRLREFTLFLAIASTVLVIKNCFLFQILFTSEKIYAPTYPIKFTNKYRREMFNFCEEILHISHENQFTIY